MNTKTTSRSPWPIAIVTFFACAIVGIVAFIIFASHHKMELVRPDYYAEEMRFQDQLDRLKRTQSLATKASLNYNAAAQWVQIQIPTENSAVATGTVQFYRPSDARLDRTFPLAIDANGVQRVDARNFSPGLWKVRVQWSSANQEYFLDETVIIAANPS